MRNNFKILSAIFLFVVVCALYYAGAYAIPRYKEAQFISAIQQRMGYDNSFALSDITDFKWDRVIIELQEDSSMMPPLSVEKTLKRNDILPDPFDAYLPKFSFLGRPEHQANVIFILEGRVVKILRLDQKEFIRSGVNYQMVVWQKAGKVDVHGLDGKYDDIKVHVEDIRDANNWIAKELGFTKKGFLVFKDEGEK
jgi:hypothetical protein